MGPFPNGVQLFSVVCTVGLLFLSYPLFGELKPSIVPETAEPENPVTINPEISTTTEDIIQIDAAKPVGKNDHVFQNSVESQEVVMIPTTKVEAYEVMHPIKSGNNTYTSVQDVTLNFTDCTGFNAGIGRILQVLCPPFSNGEKILLKKGVTYNFTIKFEARENSKYITPEVYGMGIFPGGLRAPFNGLDRNGCKTLTPACPVEAGKVYTYSSSVKILKSFYTLAFNFQWALRSLNTPNKPGRHQVCFQMPVEIVAA